MKAFISLLLIFSFSTLSIGQTYVGDVLLNTQAKVDSFGALGYDKINGHLRITDTDITDISSLEELTEINGNFTILNSTNLPSLNGLHNINTVTGVFLIRGNDLLQTLNGLNALDSVHRHLIIQENSGLINLNGLNNLTYVSKKLEIKTNGALISLSGLDNLSEVSSDKLTISNNPSLTTINSLNQLTHCYNIKIEDNPVLNALNAFSSLTTSNNISIKNCEALQSLNNAFEQITQINNLELINLGISTIDNFTNLLSSFNLTISNNNQLISITNMHNLTSCNTVTIASNFQLETIGDFSSLSSINDLYIQENVVLSALPNFPLINTVHLLHINSNDMISSLSGLSSITTILWDITIANNSNLKHLTGLGNLSETSYLHINNNPSLKSLYSLENLTFANGVTITGNDSLANFCSINNLVNVIDSTMDLYYNFGISGNLYNPTLIDLQNGNCIDCTLNPLDDSVSEIFDFQITANQPGATYQWLNCDSNYTIIPGDTSQMFTSYTYGNFAVEITYFGCVDTTSCKTIDTFGSYEVHPFDLISVYPNPTHNFAIIDFGNLQNLNINVYNQLGQIVYKDHSIHQELYTLNASTFTSGVYHIEVYDSYTRKQFKLIKQ